MRTAPRAHAAPRVPAAPPAPAAARGRGRATSAPVHDGLRPALDTLRLALFTLILMNVSRIHQHITIVGRMRPALLAMGIACMYAVLRPSALPLGGVLRQWQGRTIVALLGLACLSAPFGLSLGASGKFILDVYVKVILCALFVAASIRTARDLYLYVWAYVGAAAVLTWMSFTVFRLQAYNGYSRLAELYTYDSNDAGLVLLVGFPLAVLTFQSGRALGKVASAGIVLALGAAIARTGSRGALVGLGVVAVALLLSLRQISVAKRVAVMAAAVVALVAFAPPGYWQQMQTILSPKDDYNWTTENGRKQVALRGLGYMARYPVFGIGINNFARAECTIADKAINHVDNTALRCTAPHNTWIQVASELGVGGITLWVTLLVGSVVAMRRLQRRLPRAWLRGSREQRFLYLAPTALALSMVGFMITSTLLTFAWLDIVYIIVAMMIGLHRAVEHALVGAMPPAVPHLPAGAGAGAAATAAAASAPGARPVIRRGRFHAQGRRA